jgi:hypothetical protein
MKHPGHTYGGFVPAISEWGMTFFWQNIVCRFGVPRKITVNNAKQFDCHIFKDFCHQMGVEAAFTSIYHPQSNGAVKKANALIFIAIEKIQENQSKGKWVELKPNLKTY